MFNLGSLMRNMVATKKPAPTSNTYLSPSVKLTDNFQLSEFLYSERALRANIDNTKIPAEYLDNLKHLCEEILQPAHNYFRMSYPGQKVFIRVTSGWRSKKLNKLIGGSATSFHRFGMAADVELWVDGIEKNDELYAIIKSLGNFTELVWEYGNDEMPAWVHVAIDRNQPNRHDIKRRP